MVGRAIGGIAWVVALVLAGCTGPGQPTATSPTASAATSAAPAAGQFMTPPSGVIDEDTGEIVGVDPVPEWDEESRSSVVDAAETAMRAFAQPDLSYDDWWVWVEPLLTQQAAQDYAHVDPANIPAHEVTGGGVIVEDTSAYVATVEVPTDVGAYRVLLIRQDADAPWLVSRLTPPESE